MKKTLTIILTLLSLTACATADKKDATNTNKTNFVKVAKSEKKFYTVLNQEIKLTSTNDFETATLVLGENSIQLKGIKSASGIILVNEEAKVELGFKEGQVAYITIGETFQLLFENPISYQAFMDSATKKQVYLSKVDKDIIVVVTDKDAKILYKNDPKKEEYVAGTTKLSLEKNKIKLTENKKVFNLVPLKK